MQAQNIGIIGATGYVGMELVRILSSHPSFTLTRLTSQTYEGKRFSDLYPAFRQMVDLPLTAADPDDLADACDLVITALPHGVAAATVPDLLRRGLRVLDHSGDFRYRNVETYEKAYHLVHPAPELLDEAVYGLPELYRDQLADTRLAANPGCYPTCSLLGLLPVLRAGLADPGQILISAVSGVSGAGRQSSLAFSFCETDNSCRPYSAVGHRHTSEIEQEIGLMAGLNEPPAISFTPHLIPVKRGMLATIHIRPGAGVTETMIAEAFSRHCADEPFLRLLPAGQLPETRHVAYTNFCDLSFVLDPSSGWLKIFSAIDNLGKGAAAQAVQTLNCMTGRPETEGLLTVGGSI